MTFNDFKCSKNSICALKTVLQSPKIVTLVKLLKIRLKRAQNTSEKAQKSAHYAHHRCIARCNSYISIAHVMSCDSAHDYSSSCVKKHFFSPEFSLSPILPYLAIFHSFFDLSSSFCICKDIRPALEFTKANYTHFLRSKNLSYFIKSTTNIFVPI